MFSNYRKSRPKENGSVNYLASVADLMAGLLFVFIALLLSTVINSQRINQDLKEANENLAKQNNELKMITKNLDEKKRQVEETRNQLDRFKLRLGYNAEARANLLKYIQQATKMNLEIDITQGKLRIPENAITFKTGKSDVDSEGVEKLKIISSALEHTLECYVKDQKDFGSPRCLRLNPYGNTLEAIFIEGHTDNQRFPGDETDTRNRTLAAARSLRVYDVIMEESPNLRKMTNTSKQVLFSVSGYGSDRPLPGHKHAVPTNDSANRRIEIRFIFTEPKLTDEELHTIDTLLEAFDQNMHASEPASNKPESKASDAASIPQTQKVGAQQ